MKVFAVMNIRMLLMGLLCASQLAYAQGSGKALHFNGSSNYVACPAVVPGTSNFSWEGWIDFSGVSGVMAITGTWRYASPSTIPYFYIVYGFPAANSVTATFYHGLGTGGNVYATTGGGLALQGWHHVAATYNRAGMMILYLDGVQMGTANISTWASRNINAGHAMMLGQGGSDLSWNAYLNGQMDEVRIWNRVLTAAEIRQNMARKLMGTEAGLVAYYRMDEGVAATCLPSGDVCDASGNNNHGTLH